MRVFSLAMKVALRYWQYLLIYGVALGCIALAGSGAFQTTQSGDFQETAPKVAVIDRDNSATSRALSAFALSKGTPVEVEDSTFGLQDAAAKDSASYVLIIPETFEADLREAAKEGVQAPTLENVVSYQNAQGSLANEQVKGYVQTLYGFYAATDASAEQVVSWADEVHEDETPVGFVSVDSTGLPKGYVNYASFSAYALFTAVSIFIAVGFAPLRRSDARRRLMAAPVPNGRYGMQLALACALCGLAVWAVLAVVGLAVFDPMGAGASAASIAVVVLAQLTYALMGTAFGFLLLQLGAGTAAANGAGNIVGLVLSFFGGGWGSFDLMGEGMRAVVTFTPFYWATSAMELVCESPDVTSSVMLQAFGYLGVSALFAVAIAVVALAVGRSRQREHGV